MHDARDAEDTRLLAAGEYSALVESYFETMAIVRTTGLSGTPVRGEYGTSTAWNANACGTRSIVQRKS